MKTAATALTLVDVLNKILDVKRALLWKLAEKHRLTPLQIQILQYIQKCASHSRVNAHQVARELYVTRATMSVALKALEKKRLIRKISASDDKRTQYLSLAGKSEDILREIQHFEGRLASYASKFSEKSIGSATALLVQLLAFMQDGGMVDHVTMCVTCGNCRLVSKNTYRCELTGRKFSFDAIKIGCCTYQNKEAGNARQLQ